MAESTIGGTTGGEVLVEFLDRPKPKPKSTPMVGAGMSQGMTNKGMRSGTVLAKSASDSDYLGYGFDVAVRKGVNTARSEFSKRIANLEEGKKRALMAKFESDIASQRTLQKDVGLGSEKLAAVRDAAKNQRQISTEDVQRFKDVEGQAAVRAKNAAAIKSIGNTITNVFPKPKATPQMQSARESYNSGSSY
jgi:hypothetical protein